MLSSIEAEQWVSDHRYNKHGQTDEEYMCDDCGYCGVFEDVEGHNGWDSYAYTICPKCGGRDTTVDLPNEYVGQA